LKKVMFISKRDVETVDLKPEAGSKVALISIHCPGDDLPILKGTWNDVLHLEFHDLDRVVDEKYTLFSEDDAQRIIDFVARVARSIVTLVVNCDAGISRSAGVAKAIAEVYDLEFNHAYPLYNKRVYRILKEAYWKE
jgi:predicted protein tyrosine phosphatase